MASAQAITWLLVMMKPRAASMIAPEPARVSYIAIATVRWERLRIPIRGARRSRGKNLDLEAGDTRVLATASVAERHLAAPVLSGDRERTITTARRSDSNLNKQR
jgi:hypothetical protein